MKYHLLIIHSRRTTVVAQQSLRLSVKTVILCCQFLFSASLFQHYIIVLQLIVLHHIRLKSVTQHQQEVSFRKESTIHFSLYIPYFANTASLFDLYIRPIHSRGKRHEEYSRAMSPDGLHLPLSIPGCQGPRTRTLTPQPFSA